MSRMRKIETNPTGDCTECHKELKGETVTLWNGGAMHAKCYDRTLPPIPRALCQIERFEEEILDTQPDKGPYDLRVRLCSKDAAILAYLHGRVKEKDCFLQTVVSSGLKAAAAVWLEESTEDDEWVMVAYTKLFAAAYDEALIANGKQDKNTVRN